MSPSPRALAVVVVLALAAGCAAAEQAVSGPDSPAAANPDASAADPQAGSGDGGDAEGGGRLDAGREASVLDGGKDASVACRPADGGAGISSLVANGFNGCFIRAGEVWCWGGGSEGALGDGQPAAAHDSCPGDCAKAPVRVLGITDAIQVAAGGNTECALRANGHVVCWGYGLMGQLGDGVATHLPCGVGSTCARAPVDVTGLTDATAISVGDEHACALRQGGAVVCWGNNYDGQLGTSDAGPERCQAGGSIAYPCSRTPIAVPVPPLTAISAGGVTTCGLTSSAHVWCWGSNQFGENGNGQIGVDPTPVEVSGLTDAVEVSAAFRHVCARRLGGSVVCWGWAMDGEMGDALSSHPSCTGAPCASTPVAVSGLTDAVAIDAKWTHTCAVRASGSVVCWGDDRGGEIGDGPASDTCQNGACRVQPVIVNGLSDVTTIATGSHFSLFLTSTCELWGTGQNYSAQLGTGDTTLHDAPVRGTAVSP